MTMSERCILVVEDHPPLLEGLGELLGSVGYSVLAALSGEKALKTMEESRPDLILADIMMPGMDGYELYEEIQARPEWRDIPFVFLTALLDETHRLRAQKLGVDAYITKLVEPDVLVATIDDILTARAAGQ